MKHTPEKLRQQFEETGYASWVNCDLYPDGKLYTKEYTEWLEQQLATLTKEMNDIASKAWEEGNLAALQYAIFGKETFNPYKK